MKTYTKKEIAHLLNVSPRTVHDDVKFLYLKPVEHGDYGMKVYSEESFQLISKLREHCCEPGKTRESFVIPSPVEIVDNKLQTLPKLEVVATKKKDNFKQIVEQQMQVDILFDLELLQRISDHKWLLPTKRLADIIGVSSGTLVKNTTYNHCGFVCSKEVVNGRSILWKVEANNS